MVTGGSAIFKAVCYTRVLLDHLPNLAGYVPIDISYTQLIRVVKELASSSPLLDILPVCADYTDGFELPKPDRPGARVVVFFPGSTIGNFEPEQARHFLQRMAGLCGPASALLIGVDLKKDAGVLERAYNDDHGVTAAFNLNLLERINRELKGDFELRWFEHYAFYNPAAGRVEMHLVSLRDQTVHVDGAYISLAKGESIWTESSYKFSLEEFERMVAVVGLAVERVWTDPRQWFSIQCLVRAAGADGG